MARRYWRSLQDDYEDSVTSGSSLAASRTYGWVDTRGWQTVRFALDIASVASTAGTFKLQEKVDGFDGSAVDIDMSKAVIHGNSNSATIAAGTVELTIAIENPSDHTRLVYTRTGGGGADQLVAKVLRVTYS